MSINPKQFLSEIAVPTLLGLEAAARVPYTDTALNLCMGTVAQESLLGTYLAQESGPALGIGQIEPATLADLIGRLSPWEAESLSRLAALGGPVRNVVVNLAYAFAIVRLFYWKVPHPLPENTVSGLFAYYKQHYNTPAGAATLGQWRQNWLLTGIQLPP